MIGTALASGQPGLPPEIQLRRFLAFSFTDFLCLICPRPKRPSLPRLIPRSSNTAEGLLDPPVALATTKAAASRTAAAFLIFSKLGAIARAAIFAWIRRVSAASPKASNLRARSIHTTGFAIVRCECDRGAMVGQWRKWFLAHKVTCFRSIRFSSISRPSSPSNRRRIASRSSTRRCSSARSGYD